MEQEGKFGLRFWSALQITHFFSTLPAPGRFARSLTTFEKMCSEAGAISHTLSANYELLITPKGTNLLNCVQEWEQELGKPFSSIQLQHILKFTHESSICAKIQETNLKIFTRWYRTPVKLKRIFSDTSDLCWRCRRDMLHIFWKCPKLKKFWTEVRRIVQNFMDDKIPEDPAFFLLHASHIPEKVYKESIIHHLLDAAKACIPLTWKSLLPPTIGMWLRKVKEINKLEDLVLSARHQQERYSRTWSPWNIFMASEEGSTLLDSNLSS